MRTGQKTGAQRVIKKQIQDHARNHWFAVVVLQPDTGPGAESLVGRRGFARSSAAAETSLRNQRPGRVALPRAGAEGPTPAEAGPQRFQAPFEGGKVGVTMEQGLAADRRGRGGRAAFHGNYAGLSGNAGIGGADAKVTIRQFDFSQITAANQ